MARSLHPGLTIHLHRCGLEKGDPEVGALGDADAGAQPALDLALVRGGWGCSADSGVSLAPPDSHLPTSTHHVHDARHPHHLQQPIIHPWLLKPGVAVGTPQVGP